MNYQILKENIGKIESGNFCLFGTGSLSEKLTLKINNKFKKTPEYYIDNDAKKMGTLFNGKKVFLPNEFIHSQYHNQLIIISSMYIEEINEQLENLNLIKGKDFITFADLEKIMDGYFVFKDELYLTNGMTLKIKEENAIDVLIKELFVNEDYYFECSAENPYIIDCGTNIGLSIAYFKQIYPNSQILGFEPNPELYALSNINIKNNNFDNVKILEYALSDENRTEKLYVSLDDSMAASLTKRRKNAGNTIIEKEVKCKKLSEFIKNKKVHFLKLDIEGVEDKVIEEISNEIKNIKYIFCEYHSGLGLNDDRLLKILNVLYNNDFEFNITKSYSFTKYTSYRPFNFVGKSYSSVIYAKNKNWIED